MNAFVRLFAGRALPLCLYLLASSCGRGDDAGGRNSTVPQMHFNVEPSLLGTAVSDSSLRLVFRPPVALRPADAGLLQRMRDEALRGAGGDNPLAVEPVLLFVAPRGGALCRVARFVTPPGQGLSPAWIDSCRTALERQVAPAAVACDLYRVGRSTVVAQFLTRNESMVLLRLVCRGVGPVPFLVDYLSPVGDYPGLARAIESSIGSMETF